MMNKVNYNFDISELTGYTLSIDPAILAVETFGACFSSIRCTIHTNINNFQEFIKTIKPTTHCTSYQYKSKIIPKQIIYSIELSLSKALLEAVIHDEEYITVNIFFLESDIKMIEQFIQDLHAQFPQPQKNNKINIITNQHGALDLIEFELEQLHIDLALNYGKNFMEVNDLIVDHITNKNKGIILLHGDPGTGKTSYIKYLTGLLGEKKKIIYIPPDMANSLSDPGLINFLSEHKNSVLIIEDAENIIKSRKNNHNQAVSNLLNLSDGILSDLLKIQIICTFNCDVIEVDAALLRKGRLVALHKFEALTLEDSQKLIDSLNLEYKATKPMVLADIYNLKQKIFLAEKRKIGFTI